MSVCCLRDETNVAKAFKQIASGFVAEEMIQKLSYINADEIRSAAACRYVEIGLFSLEHCSCPR